MENEWCPPWLGPWTPTFHLDPIGEMRESMGQPGRETACEQRFTSRLLCELSERLSLGRTSGAEANLATTQTPRIPISWTRFTSPLPSPQQKIPGIKTIFFLVPPWEWLAEEPQNCQVLIKELNSGPFTMYINFVGGNKPGEKTGNKP